MYGICQARALEELAKKVFHVLETDLENFQVNFTAKRGRSSRMFDDLTFGSCRKLARDAESNKMHNDLGHPTTGYSVLISSNFKQRKTPLI